MQKVIVAKKRMLPLMAGCLFLLGNVLVNAQSVSLGLSSGASAPGGIVALNLVANSTSAQLGSVLWSLSYPANDLVVQSVTSGAAATGAGKSVTCDVVSGRVTCAAAGISATSIPNGVVANITFQVAPSPSSSNLAVRITGSETASSNGDPVPTTSTDGNVAISLPAPTPVAAVKTLICGAPSSTGGAIACSVTLTAPAGPSGLFIAFHSNNLALTVPASVTAPAGQTSVPFTATSTRVTNTTTVNVTATANGTVSTNISLISSRSTTGVNSVSCTTAAVTLTRTGTCTVVLTAVVSAATQITLTSSSTALTVPASVTLPAGSDRVPFTVSTNSSTASGTANVTAKLGTSTASGIVTLGSDALPAFKPIRLNAGAAAYQDGLGQIWAADAGFLNGVANDSGQLVSNTSNPALYRSERRTAWDDPTLKYRFAVPNGTYKLTLKFAELFFTGPNLRTFDVFVNGTIRESRLDLFLAAGGINRAIDRTYTVTVTNGSLSLDLVTIAGHAQVCAIEIVGN